MVPECWHGDVCPWHKRGRCLFKHCLPPPVELTGGEVPVEQQLRDLRRTLQRLAAAVMWRGGKVIPEERIPKSHRGEGRGADRRCAPSPSAQGENCGSPADHASRARAESYDGAERGHSVPPLMEEIVEVRQTIPQELVQNRNEPVPQFPEETDEVVKLLLAERMPERTVEQIGSMSVPQIQEQITETTPPVPQILKEVVEVGKILPQESISKRTCEHIIDVLVPQIREQIVEVAEITPQGRISERIVVQTEDVPGPQNFEEIAEVEKAVPEEGISERTVVQTVGVPVPQNSDEIVEVVRAVKTVPERIGAYARTDR